MSIEVVQGMIDNYAKAGANLLDWLTIDDLVRMPKPRKYLFGLITIEPKEWEYREWANDIACRATFNALADVIERMQENEPD